MSELRVQIRLHRPDAVLPAYATTGAAGLDISAALDEPIVLLPGGVAAVPCGFSLAVPPGFEAQVRPRSGIAVRHGVTVLNTPGTIDSDYRGEVKAILINHGAEPFTVTHGMRIAQLVIAPVMRVEWERSDELSETARGSGGFGHTGN